MDNQETTTTQTDVFCAKCNAHFGAEQVSLQDWIEVHGNGENSDGWTCAPCATGFYTDDCS